MILPDALGLRRQSIPRFRFLLPSSLFPTRTLFGRERLLKVRDIQIALALSVARCCGKLNCALTADPPSPE